MSDIYLDGVLLDDILIDCLENEHWFDHITGYLDVCGMCE